MVNITDTLRTSVEERIIFTFTRKSSVDEISERYRLNHTIVVDLQAACQAVVCVTMCLQAS